MEKLVADLSQIFQQPYRQFAALFTNIVEARCKRGNPLLHAAIVADSGSEESAGLWILLHFVPTRDYTVHGNVYAGL